MLTTHDPRRLRHLAPVGDGVPVYLDSTEENMVLALALNAHHILGGAWNGWARPVATAKEFADFLARWRQNDPHGTWGHTEESDEGLLYQDTEDSDLEIFPRVGTSTDGDTLYDLTGWMWVRVQVAA